MTSSSPAAMAACTASSFTPSLFGASILHVFANPIHDHSGAAPAMLRHVMPTVQVDSTSFCNVTIQYTHPGQDDLLTVETWLPSSLSDSSSSSSPWNGRFLGTGGGGWIAGRDPIMARAAMLGAVSEGYATVTTDGGQGSLASGADAPWALKSAGNVDLFALQNFASVALNDAAVLGKQVTAQYYGKEAEYSYFAGCSGGGRQGLMLAQRFPDAYDGISVGAPAVYWEDMAPMLFWPYQVLVNMEKEGQEWPDACEVDAISAAARAFCDGLDGVEDGLVSDGEACLRKFDPEGMVGKTVMCPVPGTSAAIAKLQKQEQEQKETVVTISPAAVALVKAAWQGPVKADGTPKFPGLMPSADMTAHLPGTAMQPGVVNIECAGSTTSVSEEEEGDKSEEKRTCTAFPCALGVPWLKYFGARDADADVLHLTHEEYDKLVYEAKVQYPLLRTGDADLSAFKKKGGKMVTFHGLDDQLLTPKATQKYYHSVAALDADVHSFYRYFEVPGLGHCFGGTGGVSSPTGLFAQLRAWVENGTAPESTTVSVQNDSPAHRDRQSEGGSGEMRVCPYPQRARLGTAAAGCDDAGKLECWACVGGDLGAMAMAMTMGLDDGSSKSGFGGAAGGGAVAGVIGDVWKNMMGYQGPGAAM